MALDSPEIRVVAPRLGTQDELAYFHTPAYIQAVEALSRGALSHQAGRYGFGPGDNPVFRGMFDSERRKVGSALQGAEFILAGDADTVFSISGGLHHGRPEAPYGFCVFNDAAVVIQWLSAQELKVVYIDIDVHHGDGVQDAFYETDQVLTISLHQNGRTLFPGTGFIEERGFGRGRGFNINLPLPPYTGDEAYLEAFDAVVPPMVTRFSPDIMVTQLGVDTHYLDPLANLALTTHGHAALFHRLRAMGLPWLALGGGGYHLEVVPRSWTLALFIMADLIIPEEIPASLLDQYSDSRIHFDSPPSLQESLQGQVKTQVREVLTKITKFHGI
jgi:acetoin utilization protein AcuC